jgi:hypothetical protein
MTTQGTPQPPGSRVYTIEDLGRLQPGLGRLMPEIGTRTWKLYYAAKAGNWPLAEFQLGEIRGLMTTCAFTRPQYEENLRAFINDYLTRIKKAVDEKDFAAFESEFQSAVSEGNRYHEHWNKNYIVWKLPSAPPPDLDMTPR